MGTPAGEQAGNAESRENCLTPLLELGVADAYRLARDCFGLTDLPSLEAIENEDWGRDYLLSRLAELPDRLLASAGLTRIDLLEDDPAPSGPH